MARNQRKVGKDKCEIIESIPMACADELAAVEFMEQQRWQGDPCCPHCGDTDVYAMKDRKTGERNKDNRWRCRGCGKLYTVRTGTVMEDSRVPLRHWCYAFWRACTSKKGVSALEIKRQTGLSYKSALFLMHRIRFAMAPTDNGPKLNGTVEADETFIGGKPRYPQKRMDRMNRTKLTNHETIRERKSTVFAAVQRNGQARVRVIPEVTAKNLKQAVTSHVDRASRLITDEHWGYRAVGKQFDGGHDRIHHSRKIYVRGDVTTNTVESFFALLKRGIHGIYHNVSKKHLQRYLDEFEFRYNHRKMDDGERAGQQEKVCVIARLGPDGVEFTGRRSP